MNLKENMNEKEFIEWVRSGERELAFKVKKNTEISEIRETAYFLLRVERDENFDFLYLNNRMNQCILEFGNEFSFAGVYCKKNGKIYNPHYLLEPFVENERPQYLSQMKDDFCLEVRQRIEEIVNKAPDVYISSIPSEIDEVNTALMSLKLQRINLDTCEAAQNLYILTGDTKIEYKDLVDVNLYAWMEDIAYKYILDPKECIEAVALDYIENFRESIGIELLRNKIMQKELDVILADKQNSCHAARKIRLALQNTDAKKIVVTIRKLGKSFTFRADRKGVLKYLKDYCSSTIVTPDRKVYEDEFGCANYTAAEIQTITYKKKIIYSANDALLG